MDSAKKPQTSGPTKRSTLPIQIYRKVGTSTATPTKQKPSNDSHNLPSDTRAERTKVVVRLLPPTMTSEAFKDTLGERYSSNTPNIHFIPGQRSSASSRPGRNSVCYIKFTSTAEAEEFVKFYHGKVLVDDKHETFRAVATFSPTQINPPRKGRDPRENTIESDPTYQAFLKEFEEGKSFELLLSKPDEEKFSNLYDDQGVVLSPLLLHIRRKHNVVTKVGGKAYDIPKAKRDRKHRNGRRKG